MNMVLSESRLRRIVAENLRRMVNEIEDNDTADFIDQEYLDLYDKYRTNQEPLDFEKEDRDYQNWIDDSVCADAYLDDGPFSQYDEPRDEHGVWW